MRREPGAHTGSMDSLRRPVWSLLMTGLQGRVGEARSTQRGAENGGILS